MDHFMVFPKTGRERIKRNFMNKQELIHVMSVKTGMTERDIEKSLKAFTSTVTETLKSGEKVQLIGFGTFAPVEKKERIGRNPQNGEPITIPGKRVPKFYPGDTLKKKIM